MKRNGTVKLLSAMVATAVVSLFVFSLFQLRHLHSHYSVRDFFPENHQALDSSEVVARKFQLRDSPAFLVSLKLKKDVPGDWLRKARMERLLATTRDVAAWDGVKQALSLATVELAVEEKRDLLVGPFAETVPPHRWHATVRAQSLLRPLFISKDLKSVLLLVEPSDLSPEGLAWLDRRLRREIGRAHPEAWAAVTGVPAIQTKLAQRVEKEVGRSLALCLLAFMGVFAIFYRGWQALLFAGLSLALANVVTLGLLAAFGIPFTVLLSTLPIVVSLTVVSMCVHTLPLWNESSGSRHAFWSERTRALAPVLRSVIGANFLGCFTTAVGFAVLAITVIPAIRQYALTMAGMVMFTWLLMHGLFYLGLPLFEARPREFMRFPRRMFAWSMRFSRSIVYGTVAVSVLAAILGVGLNFSGRLFDDLPRDEIARQAMRRVDFRHGGTVPYDVTLAAAGADAWKDPAALRQLDLALKRIRRVHGVGSALSISDFMAGRLPKNAREAAETYFLFSLSPENPLREFLSADAREARVSMRLRDLPSHEVDRVRGEVTAILKRGFPRATLTESGLSVNSHTINREVAQGLVFGFWHSLAVISLALLPVLRSFRLSLLSIIPNLVPPSLLIGVMALLQTPVKPGIALIFSIAIGLAFNNTVYLLLRLRGEDRRRPRTVPSLLSSWRQEMVPCLSESLIMAVGFSLFMISSFGLNQTFGAYMLLAIAAGGWADLIFLPALLKRWPGLFKARVEEAAVVSPSRDKSLPRAAAVAAVVTLASLLFLAPEQAAARKAPTKERMAARKPATAEDADTLLNLLRRNLEARSESARIKIEIIEANGDRKTREIELLSLREGGTYRARARVLSPADLKGTALLAEVHGETQNQWLYLPSTRQVRRVVSGRKSAGVLGSELSPDDLDPSSLRGARRRIVKSEGGVTVIEIRPGSAGGPYSRALLEISRGPELPKRIQYFQGAKVVKSVEFAQYTQTGGLYRPARIRVKNLVNKRGTDVELSEVKVNPSLKESDFKPAALKR